MPGGPSDGCGCAARPSSCSAESRPARTPSPGSSTGSVPCWKPWVTCGATRSRRPAAGWPGSTPSSTCSPPKHCGKDCGTTSRRPSSPRACLRSATSRGSRMMRYLRRCHPAVYRDVLGAMVRLWGHLDDLEKEHNLDFLREPDLGFAHAAWRWARGDQARVGPDRGRPDRRRLRSGRCASCSTCSTRSPTPPATLRSDTPPGRRRRHFAVGSSTTPHCRNSQSPAYHPQPGFSWLQRRGAPREGRGDAGSSVRQLRHLSRARS